MKEECGLDKGQRRALVNTVMNLRVSLRVEKFLSKRFYVNL
jgi:hypothetical protein